MRKLVAFLARKTSSAVGNAFTVEAQAHIKEFHNAERRAAIKYLLLRYTGLLFACWLYEFTIYPTTILVQYGISQQVVESVRLYYSYYSFFPSGWFSLIAWHVTWMFHFWSAMGWLVLLPIPFAAFFAVRIFLKSPFSLTYYREDGSSRFATLRDVARMGIISILDLPRDKKGKLLKNEAYKLFPPPIIPGQAPFTKVGYLGVLGRYKEYYLQLPETVTTIVCAPAGSGKTTAVVIPTLQKIADATNPSSGAIISTFTNDIKPEIFDAVSGVLSHHGGVCVQVSPGADDNPGKNILYPKVNILNLDICPPYGGDRDTYFRTLAEIEIPEKGNDPFWPQSGQDMMVAFYHYMACKVERAMLHDEVSRAITNCRTEMRSLSPRERATLISKMERCGYTGPLYEQLKKGLNLTPDQVAASPLGTWDGLPPQYMPPKRPNPQPSMPMLIDLLTHAQISAYQHRKKILDGGNQDAINKMNMGAGDTMTMFFQKLLDECTQYDYHPFAKSAFVEAAGLAPQTRSSVMKTFQTPLNRYANLALKTITDDSDISFKDLTGIWDSKQKKWRPCHLFFSIDVANLTANKAFIAAFIESMCTYLIANGPNDTKKVTEWAIKNDEVKAAKEAGLANDVIQRLEDELFAIRIKLSPTNRLDLDPTGPAEFLGIIDEAPQLPKIPGLFRMPEVGRGKKRSLMVLCQDEAQFQEIYGAEGLKRFRGMGFANVVLTVTNEETKQAMSQRAGKTTQIRDSRQYGHEHGIFAREQGNRNFEVVDLIPSANFGAIPETFGEGNHLVFIQNFNTRPIIAETPFYFKDPRLKYKVSPSNIPELAQYAAGDQLTPELEKQWRAKTGEPFYRTQAPMHALLMARRKWREGERCRMRYTDEEEAFLPEPLRDDMSTPADLRLRPPLAAAPAPAAGRHAMAA